MEWWLFTMCTRTNVWWDLRFFLGPHNESAVFVGIKAATVEHLHSPFVLSQYERTYRFVGQMASKTGAVFANQANQFWNEKKNYIFVRLRCVLGILCTSNCISQMRKKYAYWRKAWNEITWMEGGKAHTFMRRSFNFHGSSSFECKVLCGMYRIVCCRLLLLFHFMHTNNPDVYATKASS